MTVTYFIPPKLETDPTLEQIMEHPPTEPDYIVREWIRSEFNLPRSILDRCTSSHLRVWEGSFVLSQISDGKLQDHIVHFQSLPSVIRDSKRVACSFRTFKELKYVVIRVWKEEQ